MWEEAEQEKEGHKKGKQQAGSGAVCSVREVLNVYLKASSLCSPLCSCAAPPCGLGALSPGSLPSCWD